MFEMAASETPSPFADISSPAFRAIDKCPRRQLKRPTKELSWELASHAKAYLESEQYAQGYEFLYSLLAAGNSISVPAKTYAGFLAPPVQLALASTLIAYPRITTRTRSADAIKGSDSALRYLRCVQHTLDGPAYKTIRKAFSFPDERTRRRVPRNGGSPSPGAGSDMERLDGQAANAQSIWYRGEDFWHIVGWAFNCSISHKKRWGRWKLWLEVMLDFLEADWESAMKDGREDSADREIILQESLIWQYISSQDPTNRATRRRINRAVLATADRHSTAQFPEVWLNETIELKPQDEKKNPVGHVDFETGELGDYASEDEDVLVQDASQRFGEKGRPRRLSNASSDPHDGPVVSTTDAVERLGGAEAIQLRQRFVALLALVAQELPGRFADLESFFDTITEEINSFPIMVFNVFLSTSRLPALSQVALNANSLLPVTSGKVLKHIYDSPMQSEFESSILTLGGATQSFALNAKVSLVIEQLFIYMMDNDLLEATDRLRAAVEFGIEVRQSVYGNGKGKRGNAAEEEQGSAVMQAASERLLGLLEVLEMSAGKKPQPRKEKSKLLPLVSSFGSSLSSAPESEPDDDD